MSYCVQCGVKLENSLKKCPLCNTPVINPNELIAGALPSGVSPFSTVKGEVEPMKKHDIGLWLTLVFGSTALACGILNLFAMLDAPSTKKSAPLARKTKPRAKKRMLRKIAIKKAPFVLREKS